MFNDSDKNILELMAAWGVVLAVGKLLLGDKKVPVRLFIGRVIIGAGLSMAAGAALVAVPDLSPIGLVGLGSALGISGQDLLERLLQRVLGKKDNANTSCTP
jgi:hypothetical protein